MVGSRFDTRNRKYGWIYIHNRSHLGLYGIPGYRICLLEFIVWVGMCPADNERNTDSPLIFRSFFSLEWSGWTIIGSIPEWCITTIISQKDDQRIFRYPHIFEFIQNVSQGFIHTFDQGGKSACLLRFVWIGIVADEAFIGFEWRVNGIVCHV